MKRICLTALSALLILSAHSQNISGSWKGVLNLGIQKLNIVFNIGTDGTCTLDSPDQGAKGLPAKLDYVSADSLHISAPGLNMTYAGRLADGVIQGKFTQNGMSLPLTLKPGMVEMRRPQTPKPPFPYQTEEVTFSNTAAGATLAGTLTVPKDASTVVLMVTGSGQQNRDEELMGHKPFAVIADFLARNGIATLRYDDRGFGQSVGGDLKNATTADFADDAAAGIEWLRKSGRFSRVGILGHSEGGSIAFLLGALQQVDFIVSLAGPAVKGDSIILEQFRALSPTAQGLTLEQLREMPDIQQALKDNAWYRHFFNYDPTADISRVTCAVLAVNGSRDLQVASDQNLAALRRTLPANAKTVIREYPDLNHLFQHCQTGLPSEYGQIEETFAEEVLRDMVQWIRDIE
ncbi:MAG: alpha/beta fold hydrolase [Prevotella sp.]|nr:alpha/beta fold hydrolase [Prevotella sp.]